MGGRNFGIDSLKSMNRDMEKKRIVLRELSCRTASELPVPKLPDYSPAAVEAIRPLRRCTPGDELAPKLGGSSSGLAAWADEQLRLG